MREAAPAFHECMREHGRIEAAAEGVAGEEVLQATALVDNMMRVGEVDPGAKQALAGVLGVRLGPLLLQVLNE